MVMTTSFDHAVSTTGIWNVPPLHTTPVYDCPPTVTVTISHELPVPTIVACVPVKVSPVCVVCGCDCAHSLGHNSINPYGSIVQANTTSIVSQILVSHNPS